MTLKVLYLRGCVALAAAVPMLAMATPDPAEAAFTALGTKVTTYGGYAFGLAVIGTGVWLGIDMFKKGAKKGAK